MPITAIAAMARLRGFITRIDAQEKSQISFCGSRDSSSSGAFPTVEVCAGELALQSGLEK